MSNNITLYYWWVNKDGAVRNGRAVFAVWLSSRSPALQPGEAWIGQFGPVYPFHIIYPDEEGLVSRYIVQAPGFLEHANVSYAPGPVIPYRSEFVGDASDPRIAQKVAALRMQIEGDMTPSAVSDRAELYALDAEKRRVARIEKFIREKLDKPVFPMEITTEELGRIGTVHECYTDIRDYLLEQNKLDTKKEYHVRLGAAITITVEDIPIRSD